MKEKDILYKGNRKTIYKDNEQYLQMKFQKHIVQCDDAKIDLGIANNMVSAMFMKNLSAIGIKTHFVHRTSVYSQKIFIVEPLNFYVEVNNIIQKNLRKEKKIFYDTPVINFYFKKDNKNLTQGQISELGFCDFEDIDLIKEKAQRINDFVQGILASTNYKLESLRLEFGLIENDDFDVDIFLCDDITILSFDLQKDGYKIDLSDEKTLIFVYMELMNFLRIKYPI